jgi:glutamyl/glutaminyl-tRNA synthetase
MAMTCFTCGRPIINAHWLDGKMYGHECYKIALSLKYAALQKVYNDDYTKKCIAAITTLENTSFGKGWNEDFKKSILSQWNNCNKLTGKQLDIVLKKVDTMEYHYIYFALLDDAEKITEQAKLLVNLTNHHNLIEKYKDDERLHEAIKIAHSRAIAKKNKKYYIIAWHEADDQEEIFWTISDNDFLQNLQNDEYVIKQIINVN